MFQKWISNVPTDESLIKLLAEVIEKLELAMGETFKLSQIDASGKYNIVDLGMALGLIRKFQKPIFEKRPDLKPSPPKDWAPDPELNAEQLKFISNLPAEKIKEIDIALMSHADVRYLKVAFIVGKVICDKKVHVEGIPDIFYAERIRKFVKRGLLESQGDLRCMRYSEVRKPSGSET